MKYLQQREEALTTTINHLVDQAEWARAHGHPDLARALDHGQRMMLDELSTIHKVMKAQAEEQGS